MNIINVLGVKYSDIDIAEAVERSVRAIEAREGGYILAPDSATVLDARRNRCLMTALRAARLTLAGDKGIFIASSILGLPLHYKMSGGDFASALLARLGTDGKSIFLLGAREKTVQSAAESLITRFPGIKLAGAASGRFVDDTELLDEINAASPDLLLACLPSPKQELWLYEACPSLNAGITLGLGAVLENRRRESFLTRLVRDPKMTLKIPRMILAALWKRIAG